MRRKPKPKPKPKKPKRKRTYKKSIPGSEYAYNKTQTKNRAKRNAANRKLKPGPGKEVDHKIPLSKGGGGGRKNLRVVSRRTNRKKHARRA